MSHSPGPWRWSEAGPPCVKDAAEQLVFGCNVFAQPKAVDATLIAAAPTMLALLRKLEWASWDVDYGGGGRECPECTAYQDTMGDPRPGFGAHHEGCALDALLTTLKGP